MKRHEQGCFGSKTARGGQRYEGHGWRLLAVDHAPDATITSAASVVALVRGKALQTALDASRLTFAARGAGAMIGRAAV